MMKALLLILSLFLLNNRCYSESSPITVTLQNGAVTVIGTTLTEVSLNRPIYRFLGVPYGEPPIGPLRFRKPKPWKASTTNNTTINALKWSNQCINSAEYSLPSNDTIELIHHSKTFSENCLYLNIWTPEVGDGKLKPVIFSIHGGGLLWDSSSFELFNGETLAARADAVVITLSYRLSTLGFLYSDQDPEIPGNQGLWDQTLALKWVQENIRPFGGDPSKVTIRGEGAGAWSVSSLVLSPVSRHLFSNAILQSGAVSFNGAKSKEAQVARLLKGIRSVGCAEEGDRSIDRKVVECLEKLDAKEVDKIGYKLASNMFEFASQITIDGEFFPDTPHRMIETGNHKKDFNILLSTTEDEGSFLIFYPLKPDPRFTRENPASITLDQAKAYLLELIAKNILFTSELPNKTINSFYYSGLNGNFDSQNQFRKHVGIAYGDLMLGCPAIGFAKKLFTSSPDDINVYQWYFSAKLGKPKKWVCNEWAGACHCNEISAMFGVPFRIPENYINRERDISAEIIDIISNFIRTGTPGKFQPEWNKYFLELQNGKAQVVAPYYELSSEPKSYRSFKYNLKQFECETIWDKFIDDPKYYN